MALFKYDTINIGNIKAQSKQTIFWQFDEAKRSDIATFTQNGIIQYAVEKNCSCQGTVKVSDSGLFLEYSDKGWIGDVEKEIKVFHSLPGEPVMVKNDRGIDVFNPKLGYTVLKFTAKVV